MIKLENIHKVYQLDKNHSLHALKGINLTINKGEIFGVIGLSGAGKSTLIRIINMLETPTEGRVIIDGEDITDYKEVQLRKVRQSIGMIFQQFNLLSSMTVAQNVAFPLELNPQNDKTTIKAKVKELLEMVGLADKADVYPAQLSGGQKQRVGIARAIVNQPRVLIADEPTGNLDPMTAMEIMNILEQINVRGTTVLMVTHAKDIVDRMNKRVVAIEDGRIVQVKMSIILIMKG